MADTVEKQDIRGLDIDKAVKGFALINYVFKNMVNVSTTSADTVRWYQETAADLTATAPMTVANKAILALPVNLEESWTRNTSTIQEYMAEGTISEMDIKSSDIDVFSRTLLRLTRAVIKQVDTKIYNAISEDQSPVNIGTAAATGTGWDDVSGGNPILDIMAGQQNMAENGYDALGGAVWMNPKNHKDLMNYLITVKGSSIPQFSTEKVKSGVVMNLLGMRVVVNPNVVADSVWLGHPAQALTWKSHTGTTAHIIPNPGLNKKIRVLERGIDQLTDPLASYLITDTDT